MKIRKWLVDFRAKAKMTQAQLAEITGIAQNTVASIETGERNPSVPTAKKIASALGFDWQKFYEE